METYSSSSLILDSFCFLLGLTGPCFMHHLGASGGLDSYFSIKGSVDLSLSSSRNCLAAIAHLQMISIWGSSGVTVEVDWIASGLENCCKNVGSSG